MRKTWDSLGVTFLEEIKNGINSFNFETATPIQAATIPQLLNKKDVVAEAVTGSGKTLAFLIPVLQILKSRESWKKHEVGALIISPTRELALQTKQVLDQLFKFVTGITQILFVGGNSTEEDLKNFKSKGGNIVICTPGRFEDLLTSRKNEINLTSSLKCLEILILDEADRLLDYGFQKTIDTILSYLPKQRRTGLFSATQTKQLQDLIRAGLRNPVLVSVSVKAAHSTPEELQNYYIVANGDNKLAALLSFIKSKSPNKVLLFLPTCACVDYWSLILRNFVQIPVLAIHGKMKEKRKVVLEKFRNSNKGLLLCTDVMARGIDIPEVDWVLQWDPPSNASAFVHRVGRTARQGREGSSLILLNENEETYVHFIEKNQRVKLEEVEDKSEESFAASLKLKLRTLQKSDRNLVEKATRAFVSHIRAYSKHECSLILKVKELNFIALANCYGLLSLPKMPELKNYDVSTFEAISDEEMNRIGYKDKKREEIRLKKMEVYKNTGNWPGKKNKIVRKNTEPWSLAKQKKVEKKERKLKRKKHDGDAENGKKKKKKRQMSEKDMEELAKDVALLKKLKKKKISDDDFDKQFGI